MKNKALLEFFRTHPSLGVALSGGVDSSCLLALAKEAGLKPGAFYARTPFETGEDLADAKRLAESLGLSFFAVPVDLLSVPKICENGPDRCYFCKKHMMAALKQAAGKEGFLFLADGTHASDPATRPGMRALREEGTLSPFRLAGITREEIEAEALRLGLFNAEKPSNSCLATRIRGEKITPERLLQAERAEAVLKAEGFSRFRVRISPGTAKVYLSEEELPVFLLRSRAILVELEKILPEISPEPEVL